MNLRKIAEFAVIGVFAVLVGVVIGGASGWRTLPDDDIEVSAGVGDGSTTTSSSIARSPETTTTTTLAESVPAPATPEEPAPAPARPPGEVKVRLYNGSAVGGAAVKVGDRLKSAGFAVQPPGPSTGPRPETSVWYRPGYEAEAAAVADVLALPASDVAPLPEPSPVGGVANANVIVVVGNEVARA